MASRDNKKQILLESGTNELELLVFSVGPTFYGVNVAKVREIIGHVKTVTIPMTHPAILGVFKLRDSVIPLVDLQLYFEPGKPSEATIRTVILMEFNDIQIGFMVDTVDCIYRLRWDEVRPMPTADEGSTSVITSVCETDGKLVLLVDFEKIAFEINGDRNVFAIGGDAGTASTRERGQQHVLLAEDSPTIRGAIKTNLAKAGYARVTTACNGAEAWSMLEASAVRPDATPFTLVITDIEMPQMDGLHLCKRIKDHPQLRDLPVVVFSSLVSDTNLKKCEAVGANAAITKPQMTRLVGLLDELLAGPGPAENRDREELLLAID